MGLYHTAGKGTRLAPMPGSENNNKPGVKLAVTVDIDGKPSPLTILESVIKQTGVYGKSRKGRLSVFWGDQVHFAQHYRIFVLRTELYTKVETVKSLKGLIIKRGQ